MEQSSLTIDRQRSGHIIRETYDRRWAVVQAVDENALEYEHVVSSDSKAVGSEIVI